MCDKCIEGYANRFPDYYNCTLCNVITGVSMCATCTSNGSACLTCQDRYILNDQGKCIPEVISNSCEDFNPDDFTICDKCKSGYLRVMDSKTCVENCPPTYTLHRAE